MEKVNYQLAEIKDKKEAIIGFLLRIKEVENMKYYRVENSQKIRKELKEISELIEYYLTNQEIEGYLVNNDYPFKNYQEYDLKLKADTDRLSRELVRLKDYE